MQLFASYSLFQEQEIHIPCPGETGAARLRVYVDSKQAR